MHMTQDIKSLYQEIQFINAQLFTLVDRLLTPNNSGLILSAADVNTLMQVSALMHKVVRTIDSEVSIGVNLAPD